MPEGPTIKFLSSKLQHFVGENLTEATGYGEMDKSALENVKLKAVETYGKNLIFVFEAFFVTAHFGLFGSMLINERKKVNASFALHFSDEEVNFYITRTKFYSGKPEDYFNYKTDILKEEYDPKFIFSALKKDFSNSTVGDVLMDQNLFTGVGNIIRVEVLFRSKIQPDSIVAKIPDAKLKTVIKTAASYGREFLAHSKSNTVKKDALIYGKTHCPIHETELKVEKMGKVKRKTYWCEKCQKLYI